MKTFTTAEAALLAGITTSDLMSMIQQRKIVPLPKPLGPIFEFDPDDLYVFTREDIQAIKAIAVNPIKPDTVKRKSRKPQFKPYPPTGNKDYSPADLAEAWNLSIDTIRDLFRNEPGVWKLPNGGKRKRRYETMRIPPDVAVRVRRRMTSL